MTFAKTSRPNLANTVRRQRLFRRLDGARSRAVTWVCGPPGAGKTTAVSHYIATRRTRHIWYQLDSDDADVASFFFYLADAAPRRRRPLPMLTPDQGPALSTFSRRFFRELYSRLRRPFALVFDNYQEVAPASELHEVLRIAVEEVPTSGRVIVISRGKPPSTLARYQAHRRVALIDAPDLRFTLSEAINLFRALAPAQASRVRIRSVYEAVDGWCAGLVLWADRLTRGAAAPEPHVVSEVLFEYFADEVFKRAEPETQDVMLQTAFLPAVTPSEAVALTGRSNAGRVLVDLHRQNYFTSERSSRDGEPRYEYHPLFRGFLMAEATRAYAPARRAEIRRSAAGLAEASGLVETAAGLLCEAEAWVGLTGLIRRHAPIALGQGRYRTVLEWFDALPDASISDDPWLLFWRGLSQLGWRHSASQLDLQRALEGFRQHGDRTGIFTATSALMTAFAGDANVAPIEQYAAIIDDLLRDSNEFPSEEVEARVSAGMLCAVLFRERPRPDADRWADRALELARVHPDLQFRAITAGQWLFYRAWFAELRQVGTIAEDMLALMKAHDLNPGVRMIAGITVTGYDFLLGLPTYRRTVADVVTLAQATGMVGHAGRHSTLSHGVFAAVSDQDLVLADQWLAELANDLATLGPGYRAWYHQNVARVSLLKGDLTRAEANRREMLRAGSTAAHWSKAASLITSADVLHARGMPIEAHSDLDSALRMGREIASPFVEFMGRLVEAQFLLKERRDLAARETLARAMAIGRVGGYMSSYTWCRDVMSELCATCIRAGIEIDYVQALVAKRQLALTQTTIEIGSAWPIRVRTLGRFELSLNGHSVVFAGKIPRKPLMLLKAVITSGRNGGMSENRLIDVLWPDADGDAGRYALSTTLHRLRGILGHPDAVRRQGQTVSLDPRYCWVDLWTIQELLERAERTSNDDDALVLVTEQAVALYGGPFLDADSHETWVASVAESLRHRLVKQVIRTAERAERAGDWASAAARYETALKMNPCDEGACRRLMIGYHHLNRVADVETAYACCRAALAERLGAPPSAQTQLLVHELRERR